jgi:hypothetical protein
MSDAMYGRSFFDGQVAGSLESASVVVPLVLDICSPVQSVVDVGCGVGAWLSVFAERGVPTTLGLDGDYIDESRLLIPREQFHAVDLTCGLPAVGRFNLALCLEVAEHLPCTAARTLADGVARLAPVVVWAAAIPGQGGTGHVNERWPDYWVKAFDDLGYQVVDCLRGPLWDDVRVEPWYRQNLLLLISRESPSYPQLLDRASDLCGQRPLNLVHPAMWSRSKGLTLRGNSP